MPPPQPKRQGLLQLAKSAQLYWFLGHAFAILFTALTFATSFFRSPFSDTPLGFYKNALNAIIITYVIVLRQVHKGKPVTMIISQLRSLLKESNVQYLLLALVFRLTATDPGPVFGGLYPFTIYSLFHFLNYLDTTLLATLPVSNADQVRNLIRMFVSSYNEKSIYLAASCELFLVPSLLLSSLKSIILLEWYRAPFSFIRQLIVVFSVISFLRLRYQQNVYMKQLVDSYDLKISQLLYHPQLPQGFRLGYLRFKSLLTSTLGYLELEKKTR